MSNVRQLPRQVETSAIKSPPEPCPVRTYAEIYSDLIKVVPQMYLEKKAKGGQQLTFVPWFYVCRAFDHYAPGWEYEIKSVQFTHERVMVVVSITVHASDRSVKRESTGTETFKRFDERTGIMKEPAQELAYGDPLSNAEGMALRRAAAKHGFARYLYEKKKSSY